jgi:hypothetical protein
MSTEVSPRNVLRHEDLEPSDAELHAIADEAEAAALKTAERHGYVPIDVLQARAVQKRNECAVARILRAQSIKPFTQASVDG